jgi:hypothetical protein
MSNNTDRSRPYAAAGAGGGDYRTRLASGLGAQFFGCRLEGLEFLELFGCLFRVSFISAISASIVACSSDLSRTSCDLRITAVWRAAVRAVRLYAPYWELTRIPDLYDASISRTTASSNLRALNGGKWSIIIKSRKETYLSIASTSASFTPMRDLVQ